MVKRKSKKQIVTSLSAAIAQARQGQPTTQYNPSTAAILAAGKNEYKNSQAIRNRAKKDIKNQYTNERKNENRKKQQEALAQIKDAERQAATARKNEEDAALRRVNNEDKVLESLSKKRKADIEDLNKAAVVKRNRPEFVQKIAQSQKPEKVVYKSDKKKLQDKIDMLDASRQSGWTTVESKKAKRNKNRKRQTDENFVQENPQVSTEAASVPQAPPLDNQLIGKGIQTPAGLHVADDFYSIHPRYYGPGGYKKVRGAGVKRVKQTQHKKIRHSVLHLSSHNDDSSSDTETPLSM